ncbi:LacI family DNA-binding transcriptional regulator [Aureimonas populi]|uniref:LacI family DNA-binding transcriptional regulator n=1 Tax=Aureimonas populi TaxID=1701758 RepID=A0ABW5CI59_9HYPH|nr:LacI family DNA-binding transcriptional regulator [Aureimonas populi]
MRDGVPGFATLRDVARHAGVSLATADRVVNRRGGASARSTARVEAAVAALDFRPDPRAADLSRKRLTRLGLVVPRGENPFFSDIAREARCAAADLGGRRVLVEVVETDIFSPRALALELVALGERMEGLAVVGFDHPLVAEAVDALEAKGVAVVTLVSDVPRSARRRYIGIDNRAAGRVAGSLVGRFLGRGGGRVGVLVASLGLTDHLERLAGFRDTIAGRFPAVEIADVLEGRDERGVTRAKVSALLAGGAIDAIYNAGAANAGVADALGEAGAATIFVGHELTQETRPLILSGVMDAAIVQSAGHEARSALRLLLAELTGAAVVEDQERIRIEILMADNLPG